MNYDELSDEELRRLYDEAQTEDKYKDISDADLKVMYESALLEDQKGKSEPVSAEAPSKSFDPFDKFTNIMARITSRALDPIRGGAQEVRHAVQQLSPTLAAETDKVDPWVYEKTGGLLGHPKADYDQTLKDIERVYQDKLAPEGLDIAGGVGTAIPFLMNAPTSLARAAGTAGLEAMFMPTYSDNPGLEKALQVAGGTVLGPLGYGAGKAISTAADPFVKAISRKLFPESAEAMGQRAEDNAKLAMRQVAGDLSDSAEGFGEREFSRLKDKLLQGYQSGNVPDAQSLIRRQDFENAGVTPLQGWVTRDPIQFSQEKNLRGVSGFEELTHGWANAERQIRERLEDIVGRPAETGSQGVNAGLMDALKAIDDKAASTVSDLYKRAREHSNRRLDVPLQGIAQAYGKLTEDYAPEVLKNITHKLGQYGIGMDMAKQLKVFDMSDAENTMKVLNSHYGKGGGEDVAISTINRAIKDAISGVEAEGGPFSAARDAARTRFQMHEKVPALETAGAPNVNPDTFGIKNIINASTQQVRDMAELLRQSNPEGFANARQIIGDQIHKAAMGKAITGDTTSNPASFAQVMKDIGEGKLSAFFSPEEVSQLKSLSRVSGYINSEPAGAFWNRSNTATAGASLLSQLPIFKGAAGVLMNGKNYIDKVNAANRAVSGELPMTSGLTRSQQSVEDIIKSALRSSGTAEGSDMGSRLADAIRAMAFR